jgi:DNA-binding SARP family transcriptional activator
MQNLARQMEAAATVQFRAQAFKEWEAAHPTEPVSNFIQSAEYDQAKSKARALVAREFADTPEANYAFRGKKSGRLYVIKPNGESEYVE